MNLIPPAMASDRFELMVYGLAILTILYVVFRPMLRKRKDPLERTPILSLSTQKTVERDMQNLLVELSEMARQITAQLETRAAKLQAMIDEADRKIEELKRLERHADTEHAPLSTGSDANDARPTPATMAQPHPMMRLVPQEQPPGETADAPDDTNDRYAEIHALADQGRTPGQIAQQLGRPIGEIELILALRVK
jgi:hypothetical protein